MKINTKCRFLLTAFAALAALSAGAMAIIIGHREDITGHPPFPAFCTLDLPCTANTTKTCLKAPR